MNPNAYLIKEADPELERLLREEEKIEHQTLHHGRFHENCTECATDLAEEMNNIFRFEQYRSMLQRKYA